MKKPYLSVHNTIHHNRAVKQDNSASSAIEGDGLYLFSISSEPSSLSPQKTALITSEQSILTHQNVSQHLRRKSFLRATSQPVWPLSGTGKEEIVFGDERARLPSLRARRRRHHHQEKGEEIPPAQRPLPALTNLPLLPRHQQRPRAHVGRRDCRDLRGGFLPDESGPNITKFLRKLTVLAAELAYLRSGPASAARGEQ